ncbi:ferredoxin--NADP reductase [Marinifilum flexuosum]|uniref:Ferredoxin--NADP+ reductase/benzoate/toluate 1,2-dioxygenase reductase subunit n=1 Tax=Marinifilum flexuosum TaxID=1117708 RepID=A0A419WT65_9BACT|nr:FAD-binding oxidoreductase [Marinifilum flexuosum]RKD98669.1 ferredoxin--NADP+ reductase/benzoate/toluate 1,2-dioxygenase reductase subunit [Marinifilum flexuosum]
MRSHKVIEIRNLTLSTYIIKMEKKDFTFKTGQYITLGFSGSIDRREYSIYSSEQDNFLEVLIKEVEDGLVSKKLKRCKPGDYLDVDGPFGHFSLKEDEISKKKFLFIATGTGISPIHSFIATHPNMDYQLLHGVRMKEEAYERESYQNNNYILCTSREKSGDFHGRVTEYLKENPVPSDTVCYLCGNCHMIYEAYDILEKQGINLGPIHTEVYF